jgi:hypothetical protein
MPSGSTTTVVDVVEARLRAMLLILVFKEKGIARKRAPTTSGG